MWTVFSTAKSAYFADFIASHLGAHRGNIIRKKFGDGEQYYRLDIDDQASLLNKDVIYVAATPGDEDILEVQRLGCALADRGTRRRVFVIPFYGYSTMERAVLPGEVITAKTNALLFSSIPSTGLGNTFLLMDLHVQTLLQFFEGPSVAMELHAYDILLEGIRATQLHKQKEGVVFASADLGRPKWVEKFAKEFDTSVAFIRKTRNFENTEVSDVIGDVSNKHVIIYDDMTRSGGTLIKAADAYVSHGALSVSCVLTHCALNSPAIVDKLQNSCLSHIIVTNTHPLSQAAEVKASCKFIVMDASLIFAKTIQAAFQ